MPSVLTLTAFFLREEGGRGGGLIKNFNLQTGCSIERGYGNSSKLASEDESP